MTVRPVASALAPKAPRRPTGFRISAWPQWVALDDDGEPILEGSLYSSTRWYGIRWGDGRFGYISESGSPASIAGALGLRSC